MDADLKWLIGIAVTLALALTSAIVATFRNLAARISASDRDIHARIDDVKEKYVRRDDMYGHIQRMDKMMGEIRKELRENHKQVLEALDKK